VSVGSLPSSESEESALGEFAEFYRQHYPGAVRLAWLLTHDNSSTEDVVQDAFIRLQPRFDEITDRGAYLRTCVVNGCRDRARGAQRSSARFRLVSVTAPRTSSDHPSELVDAVATLPYNQRAAVVLRYWADLTEAEIARILDVRPGTVRTLVHRALSTLRKDLPQ
jgi:RNA polymerase sigma-70 factor (sigma-E family)